MTLICMEVFRKKKKRKMKKFKFTFLLVVLMSITAGKTCAYDAEINGIYYNRLSETELEVTYGSSSEPICDSDYSYNYYSGDIVIPEDVTYRGKVFKVTQIGSRAFSGCKKITSIIIPKSITSIGFKAFFYCTSLEKVYIEDLSSWCKIPFSNEDSNPLYSHSGDLYLNGVLIKNLRIPDDVTELKDYAFAGASIETVTITGQVENILGTPFFSCSELTSVYYEDGVPMTGNIQSCKKLSFVSIPNSVTTIGNFTSCPSLVSMVIPEGVTAIGDFNDCFSLKSINIPIGVTRIGSFKNCKALEEINIPTGVTSISSFEDCTSLKEINIPEGIITIPYRCFLNCKSLSSAKLPESLITIGQWAFFNCYALDSIVIPNNVKSILRIDNKIAQSLAFNNCQKLSKIVLGEKCSEISMGAFKNCKNIKVIYCLNPTPPTIYEKDGYVVFESSIFPWADLYVPMGSLSAYKNDAYWKQFKVIKEFTPISNSIEIPITEKETGIYYSIEGKRLTEPQKGINIVKMKDGTTKKVIVK